MAFPDIELRDNGSSTFDIALATASTPSGNSNFFLFFDNFFLVFIVAGLILL